MGLGGQGIPEEDEAVHLALGDEGADLERGQAVGRGRVHQAAMACGVASRPSNRVTNGYDQAGFAIISQ